MKNYLLLIVCIITALSINCKFQNQTKKAMKEGQIDKTCRLINRTSEAAESLYASYFKKVELDENCLTIHVSAAYNEKKTSDFELRWNGKIKKSMPPQVTLGLHAAKGSEGYQAKDFILKYDLSEINNITD